MAPADPVHPQPPGLSVEVAWSPRAGEVRVVALRLPPGATVHDALRRSGALEPGSGMDLSSCRIGAWGQPRDLADAVRDRDRVEIWRALRVDPKEARRQRSPRMPRGRR